MHRLLLFFFIFFSLLQAGDKVEIYASSMDTKGDIVEASGGVSVIYKKYFLLADRAIYNRESGDLELFENIRLNQNGEYKILGKYARLNIAKKEKFFKPFYMTEKESKVWISAYSGESKKNNIKITSGSLSGCNPIDPLWKMDFSSSDYNAQTKWLNIYNVRVYIDDIPILYTPYFGYSLNKTRRSGLLRPVLGFSYNEGLFIDQPIFIAPTSWWDLEINPQLRTKRGQGIYQKFRFVDSKYSRGEFKAGYFKEFDEYFKSSKLKNNSHYGFDLKYNNSNFINHWLGTKLKGQAGLYLDVNNMNDVDYINLSSNDALNNSTSTQVLSRINMFYNTQTDYLGAYFKYYQDLTLTNNDTIAQKIPTLHYHHYLDTLFKDHFLYSLNVKSNNIERKVNKKVVQTDVNLPITLQTSLFDEYINVAYKANIYMQHSKFRGTEDTTNTGADLSDGYYMRNTHTFSLSSQLTKAYDNFSHVVGLALSYNQIGSEAKNGYYSKYEGFCSDPINAYTPQCEFYNISNVNNEVKVDFTEYLYDSSSKEVLYHRLAQLISYGNNKNRFGELENELDYKVTPYISFYNNMFFNYDKSLFSKLFNKASFRKYGFDISLSHLYKDSFLPDTQNNLRYTSYLTSSLSYTYDKHYSYRGAYNFDTQTKTVKNLDISFMYKRRCWDFGIKYSENNRPILVTGNNSSSSIYDRYLYLTIVLKPIMKSEGGSFLRYQLPSRN